LKEWSALAGTQDGLYAASHPILPPCSDTDPAFAPSAGWLESLPRGRWIHQPGGKLRGRLRVTETTTRDVTRFEAMGDRRLIGLLIPADFDQFPGYYPKDGRRAYVTDFGLPLQVVSGVGDANETGSNHVHPYVPASASWPTRHKVVVCIAGSIDVELSESDGSPVGTASLTPGAALLCTEGHRVVFRTNGSRMIEVKQGPFPGTTELDRVMID
jgi:hypothetical protein